MPDAIGQGFLFGEPPRKGGDVSPAPVDPVATRLASGLPPRLRLGTSSWTFPGWNGLVYGNAYSMSQLASTGLAAYAKHPLMRSVGLDRAFYRPPSLADFQSLAAQVPPGFRFLIKAFQGLTRPETDAQGAFHGDTRDKTLPSDLFLEPSFAAHEVVAPAVRGLGPACGPIVFQFPPMNLERVGGAKTLLAKLERFLARLAADPAAAGAQLAVEIRNRQLLADPWAKAYASALDTVAHVYVAHPSMPSVREQAERLGEVGAAAGGGRPLVVRWLLRANHFYDEAKDLYAPFDRLVEEDPIARSEIATLVATALKSESDAVVIINNKAEGSAPRSVEALAEAVTSRL